MAPDTLTVDIDQADGRFEVVARWDGESMVVAFSDLTIEQVPEALRRAVGCAAQEWAQLAEQQS